MSHCFATHGHTSPMLFGPTAVVTTSRFKDFTFQEFANIAWSFDTLQELANTVWELSLTALHRL
eukprot:9320717-Karenia_brevis.AAC.1